MDWQINMWTKLLPKDNERTKQIISYFNHILFQYIPNDINAYVCGGAVRDLFSVGYVTSDVDVYFKDRKDALLTEKTLVKVGAKRTFRNKQITNLKLKGKKIQLIRSVYNINEVTENLINSFDFTVCCGAVDRYSILLHNDFLIDLAAKRLVFHKITFPLSSMIRVHKYIKKGFKICNGNMLKLVEEIKKVDMNDPRQMALSFYPDGTPKFISLD